MDRETAEEIKRHFNVVSEGLRSDFRTVAEGLAATNERLDRIESRMEACAQNRFDLASLLLFRAG
jgi:hypothetical protein